MGQQTSEAAARHGIAFAPFAPPRHIIAVALLPPFHGDDTRRNRGIGYEYIGRDNRTYALAQWPLGGGTITGFATYEPALAACGSARTFRRGTTPNGIVWTTPRGVVMTLQADGANDARILEAEWTLLVRRGACR